jgi:ElaB/YqjD/DUF883 family membrane-anchored ribosome-binding protein
VAPLIEERIMIEERHPEMPASGEGPDRDDGTPISRKARQFAHEAIDSASTRAEDVERKLRSEARRMADRVERGEERTRHQIDETLTSMESFIRERPMAAAGMAFAAGMLAAILLRR